MAENFQRKPFAIRIFPIEILQNLPLIFVQKVEINGLIFRADPFTLRQFFERLLAELPGEPPDFSQAFEAGYLGRLEKARIICRTSSGQIEIDPQFRAAGHEFLFYLKSSRFPDLVPRGSSVGRRPL